MEISHLDHLVLTVRDVEASAAFYESVLGMQRIDFSNGRLALKFGQQKINLHQHGAEFEPKANMPAPGSADLCFITSLNLDAAILHIKKCGIEIIVGPVERAGANGPILSCYFRDPDQNLIEVANILAPQERTND